MVNLSHWVIFAFTEVDHEIKQEASKECAVPIGRKKDIDYNKNTHRRRLPTLDLTDAEEKEETSKGDFGLLGEVLPVKKKKKQVNEIIKID